MPSLPKNKLSEKSIVLLGLIAEEPLHAYALREKIDNRRMTEWTNISFASIYRVLTQLETQRLVTSHLVHEGQGATKKVYSITEQGKEALQQGLLECLSTNRVPRDPFQLGLAFVHHAPAEQLRDALVHRYAIIDGWLADLKKHRVHAMRQHTKGTTRRGPFMPSQLDGVHVHPAFEHMMRILEMERQYVTALLGEIPRKDAPDTSSALAHSASKRHHDAD